MSLNPRVVDICLGTHQHLFRFDPKLVHDIYASECILYIELLVGDQFIMPYEFEYVELDELWRDFRVLTEILAI